MFAGKWKWILIAAAALILLKNKTAQTGIPGAGTTPDEGAHQES